MNETSRGTLLVFTLGAACEARRRRLTRPWLRPLEQDLFQACLEAVVEAGRSAGLETVVASPRPLAQLPGVAHLHQETGSFGRRLRRAVAAVQGGDQPLVLVGTDTPGLAVHHLETALLRLATGPHRMVVGPSPDGGFYLLAARHPLDEILAEVRWRGPRTLDTLRAALERRGLTLELLEPLADLDRTADLERWLARGPALDHDWVRLRRSLTAALARLRRPRRWRLSLLVPQASPRTVPVRGPPG